MTGKVQKATHTSGPQLKRPGFYWLHSQPQVRLHILTPCRLSVSTLQLTATRANKAVRAPQLHLATQSQPR